MAVVYSQNGYSANDRTQCTTYTVSNSGRRMLLRKGSPGELLAHMVRWFDKNIRDIDPGIMDDWSYAERPVRGSTDVLSNHASGTAADVDATKWPLGVEPTAYLTAVEIAKIRAHLKLYEGCIRWGGDYISRKDPMHFEINRNQTACDLVWSKIQRLEATTAVTPTPVEEGPEMRVLIDNKGTMWKATDYTLRWIGTAADAAVLERAWGKAVVYNEGEIGRLRAQIEDNLAGLRSALAATADVDEEAILAKLIPVVTDALAAKAGPGMTREEVVEILQGITLKAS